MAESGKITDTGGFDVDINLTELCEAYLIKNISQIRMPRGLNVIPITWDTNEVDEYFKIIKTYIILLLEQRQKSDKDFKYSDSNNHNTIILEANNKKVNMNFDHAVFSSDNLIKTIDRIQEGIAEKTNSKTTSAPIDKLPLFILLIDTDKPDEGQLCKLNDIHTILGVVIEMVMNRFEE